MLFSIRWRFSVFFCFAMLLFGLSVFAQQPTWGISETKHNLSASGPGLYKSDTADQICVFCHTPHNANPAIPLWVHALSPDYSTAAGYEFYSSPSSDAATPSQVLGSSKLCLSCHDGTLALGKLNDGLNLLDVKMSSESGGYIGRVLSDDHPISIPIPVADLELIPPSSDCPVKLEWVNGSALIECRTCHDPHSNRFAPFLVMDDVSLDGKGGQLCTVCHDKWGWEESAHALSSKLYSYDSTDVAGQSNPQTKTVAQWGCQACHDHHGGSEIPLTNDCEEENCFRCHSGAAIDGMVNIQAEFDQAWTHPTTAVSAVHVPREVAKDYENVPLSNRHAECADCHDPHGVQKGSKEAAPALSGSILGVNGFQPSWAGEWILPSFTYVENAQFEYQICLKCHSCVSYGENPPESPSRVSLQGSGAPKQTPVDRDFNPNNSSTHAVMGQSSNPNSTFGKFTGQDRDGNDWGWASRMLCSDCHGNDDPTNEIQGPHGSGTEFILKAPYDAKTGTNDTSRDTREDLCFLCHDYEFYAGAGDLSYRSGFSGTQSGAGPGSSNTDNFHSHNRHKSIGCRSCHSAVPHGLHRQGLLVTQQDPSPYNGGSRIVDLPNCAPGNYPCGLNSICH